MISFGKVFLWLNSSFFANYQIFKSNQMSEYIKMNKAEKTLKGFQDLIDKYKNKPDVLSQLYKLINFKINHKKTTTLTTDQIAHFLKGSQQNPAYYDFIHYDDSTIKQFVLKQNFLISKGYLDPTEHFQTIKINTLDDKTFDAKIRSMFQ